MTAGHQCVRGCTFKKLGVSQCQPDKSEAEGCSIFSPLSPVHDSQSTCCCSHLSVGTNPGLGPLPLQAYLNDVGASHRLTRPCLFGRMCASLLQDPTLHWRYKVAILRMMWGLLRREHQASAKVSGRQAKDEQVTLLISPRLEAAPTWFLS